MTQYFRCDACNAITSRPNWSDEGYRSSRATYEDTGETGRFIDAECEGAQVLIPLCQCGARARAMHSMTCAMLDMAKQEPL